MPLTKAQCPSCGGTLEVDSSKEAANCPFCGSAYIVEKAISNYVTNVTNNIHADTVIIKGAENSDFEIHGVTVVSYKGHKSNVIIPDYVSKIGENAFKDRFFIESVTLPDSILEIHRGAFSGCNNLRDISFGNGIIYIGEQAFKGTAITSLALPDSVQKIDRAAFRDCQLLKSISIGKNLSEMVDNPFSYCPNLESFTVSPENRKFYSSGNSLIQKHFDRLVSGCKTSVIPDDKGIYYIGISAFAGCTDLCRIVIPSSVRHIEDYAFYNCENLSEVIFQKRRVWIDNEVFTGTKYQAMIDTKEWYSAHIGNKISGISFGVSVLSLLLSFISMNNPILRWIVFFTSFSALAGDITGMIFTKKGKEELSIPAKMALVCVLAVFISYKLVLPLLFRLKGWG